jgi:hypothetical protein
MRWRVGRRRGTAAPCMFVERRPQFREYAALAPRTRAPRLILWLPSAAEKFGNAVRRRYWAGYFNTMAASWHAGKRKCRALSPLPTLQSCWPRLRCSYGDIQSQPKRASPPRECESLGGCRARRGLTAVPHLPVWPTICPSRLQGARAPHAARLAAVVPVMKVRARKPDETPAYPIRAFPLSIRIHNVANIVDGA